MRIRHAGCMCAYAMQAACAHTPCRLHVRIRHAGCMCAYAMQAACAHTPCRLHVRIRHAGCMCAYAMQAACAHTPCRLHVRIRHAGFEFAIFTFNLQTAIMWYSLRSPELLTPGSLPMVRPIYLFTACTCSSAL